ncbi:MAG: response regulator [Thomasclavelia ramosa]
MDGYEFTEILRRVQNELPILMVSANNYLPIEIRIYSWNNDFMTKPFDEEELLYVLALLRAG